MLKKIINTPPALRLLLVGTDPAWRAFVQDGAARAGATLDFAPDVSSAIAGMLDPSRTYDHVIASAPLVTREIDALAGMLDEVTLRPTPLLLLGFRVHGSARGVRWLPGPDPAALDEAWRVPPTGSPALPLSVDEVVAALHGGDLRMRFQPILAAGDLQPIGLEALARIHSQTHGILHPRDFVPLALAGGRERVLTGIAAARTFVEIARQLSRNSLFVSINLPLPSLMSEGALDRGLELCSVAGLSPARVLLEVLESSIAPDLDALGRSLADWRRHGFRTAIDDAGPALPHWRDLLDLPFDMLKVDGALVSDPDSQELLADIVSKSKSHGRFVIVEGIEDQACLDRVRELEVDAYQGFLFSRPLPALAVPVWLSTRTKAEHTLPAGA